MKGANDLSCRSEMLVQLSSTNQGPFDKYLGKAIHLYVKKKVHSEIRYTNQMIKVKTDVQVGAQ